MIAGMMVRGWGVEGWGAGERAEGVEVRGELTTDQINMTIIRTARVIVDACVNNGTMAQ